MRTGQVKLKPVLRREPGPAAQLGAIAFYLATSAGMSFINKWTLIMYPLPMTLMVLQMAAAVIILLPLATAGLLKFNVRSWPRCKQLSGITVLYVGNAVLSLGGLAKLNVPIYTTLKRLTPIFVLLTKLLLTRQRPPWRVTAAVLLIVVGCVLAGTGDLDWNITGYCFAVGSSLLQALYLVLVEVQGAKGIPTSEMLYYNSVTALPLLLVATAATGELYTAGTELRYAVALHGTGKVLLAITLCATGGIVLNFSMFLATVVGSALTMTLVGNMKTVIVLLLGFFLLGGAKLTLFMALGILTTLIGGSWYSSLKFKPPSLLHHGPMSPKPSGSGHSPHSQPLIHRRTSGELESGLSPSAVELGRAGSPFLDDLSAGDRKSVGNAAAGITVTAASGSNYHVVGAGHHRHPHPQNQGGVASEAMLHDTQA